MPASLSLQSITEARERPALVTSTKSLSYGQLATRLPSVPVAGGSVSDGAAAEPLGYVTFEARADVDTALRVFACLQSGVPLSPMHPRLTATEKSGLISQLGSSVRWEGPLPRESAAGHVPRLHGQPKLGAPAAVFWTSGSSGRPKGVVLSRANLLAAARASKQNLGWLPDDRWLLCLPPAHVGGFSILVRCLLARSTVVLLDGPFDAERVIDGVARQRVTLMSLVPTMLERLLAHRPHWTPPAHLRAVLLGGAPARDALLNEAASRGVPLLTTYGLTETSGQVTCQPYGTHWRSGVGAGPALPGVEVRIVDAQIQVRGATVMRGYLSPRGSRERPEGNPVSETAISEGWLATGDAGELDARGNLHVFGRLDDTIISGGENVHPSEVEDALVGIGGVGSACVFPIDDPEWGQVVAAALVGEPGRPRPQRADLRAGLDSRLAPFKQPRHYYWLATLPLLPSGKVDRQATAEQARLGMAAR